MFEMHLAHLHEDLHNLQQLLEFMGSSKAFDFTFYLFFNLKNSFLKHGNIY